MISEDIFSVKPGHHREINNHLYTDKIFEFINKHCSRFLKDMYKSKKYLYHGFNEYDKSYPLSYFVGKPYQRRQSRDTPEYIQKQIDSILKSQGFIALRSNSIFCSSRLNIAKEYGEIYCIFPTDGFSYTYSEKIVDKELGVDDLMIPGYDLDQILHKLEYHYLIPFSELCDYGHYYDDFFGIIKNSKRTAKKMLLTFKDNPEVTRVLKKIINIDLTHYNEDFVKYYSFKNNNLPVGLSTGNEIYIHGTYIAVSYSKFKNDMKKYYGF